ncbi:electron transport complex subunit RsxG [Psychromonas sp. 14N.309.X.WAT.B.A12]|jgi:Na+-translocating ferredoxin:NAD+ oxidoreductase subunit G|uniref:electron transport complex subunit RsxG n=1 Tax=unclassified Psychromonas TaxID=2614957 RepID=UPI0025B17AA8|nr:electron transport complex subunit RsxG [Psychromonas sp. 14N.309.X.WAT.B.A12]MDN2663932.1 electron transport complex subunit RsxG [Psychromonas sp. 14N.309.X.WAT.B.A12]
MMMPAISRNALLLGIFAVLCTGAIALVNVLTQPVIQQQEQIALQNNINELIKPDRYDNNIIESCFTVVDNQLLGDATPKQVFIAKQYNQPVAALIQTSTFKGYSGEIKLLVGIYADGTVAGVRINSHTETPGLGDKIQTNKSDWIYSFDGSDYQAEQDAKWEVKKNGGSFDAFTGATITPRAVVFAVKNTLMYFNQHKSTLFNTEATCGDL